MAGEDVERDGSSASLRLASDVADAALHHPSKVSKAADDLAEGTKKEEEEVDGEEEDIEEGEPTEGPASGTAIPKKKRKAKKKKKKPTDGLPGEAGTTQPPNEPAVPRASTVAPPVPVNDIPSLLEQLSLSQPNVKEGKAPEDYKFWNTQPVPKFKEPNLLQTTNGSNGESLPEGPILPEKICKASAKPDPEPLLDSFDWCEVDLTDAAELQELYELLRNHYVEDNDHSFRFNYSPKFLRWALKSPGWRKEWHIGVRTKPTEEGKKGKLIAFIAGVPVQLKVRQNTLSAIEINFLTIHRKLRSKRLAPRLIKEITRRCYRNNIYQALYTAGTLLPTPVSTCRYFHRSIDWEHLHSLGFSHMPLNSTPLRQKYKYKLESHTATKGLRPMVESDIAAVKDLLTRYNERFDLRQKFNQEEITHWLCSPESKDVVWSYVVEQEGKITDFISYYLLESTALRTGAKNETIRAAYLYYYATEAAFSSPPGSSKPTSSALPKETQHLQARLQELVHDALILAKQANFHVFNALTLLDNPLFLKEQKFEPGDGKLHYYLFNWRTALLPSGVNEDMQVDPSRMGGVGVVML